MNRMTQAHTDAKALHDDLMELGKEGHGIGQDAFSGRTLAVFTSGGDAQGIRLPLSIPFSAVERLCSPR